MEKDIKDRVFITLDIDGEKRRLNKEQTVLLCKHGLKYESLKGNYERLVSAAKAENSSVAKFLDTLEKARTEKRKKELAEKCGGNEEMALHIMELEGISHGSDSSTDEFKEYFPDTDIAALPESVKESAKQNNTSLLDEFLRYRARTEQEAKQNEIKRKENEISSTGSLKSAGDISFESAEFLKGVWR